MHLRCRSLFNYALKISALSPLCLLIALGTYSLAQTVPPRRIEPGTLNITVLDENGVAVPAARIQLTTEGASVRCETDPAGHCHFAGLTARKWQASIEKE